MRVDVKLYATLRRFAPEGTAIGESFSLEVDDDTVAGVLDKLGIPHEQAKIIMVNGEYVKRRASEIQDGDLIVIFPPVGGG